MQIPISRLLVKHPGSAYFNGNIRNLCQVLLSCSKWERETGISYYPTQRARLERIASREVFPLETVVGIFCAISPNNTEDGTYRGTVSMLREGMRARITTYSRNREKASRIRDGERSEDVLRGRKVRSFYHNTMDPDEPSVVTVDGHMFSCWLGHRHILTDAAHKINDAVYSKIESDVITLAGFFGMIPCRLQSILWSRWRRMHRILTNDQLPLFPGWMLPENERVYAENEIEV